MKKPSRKLMLQNVIGTLILIAVFALIYFVFHSRFSNSDSNREISGTVKEKWTDVSETEQGSKIKSKALIELETGEKIVINFDRQTHDQIKIGTLIKRETNGDIKVLQ